MDSDPINYPHDYSYPLLDWGPRGEKFGIIYEKRDEIKLVEYDLETKKKVKDQIRNFQKIHSFDYINPVKIVLSGQNRGQTDIYTYNIPNTKTIQYTNDFYDDSEPVYYSNGDDKRIIWSSNRYVDTLIKEKLDSVLPLGTFDLFAMSIDRSNRSVTRLTNSPFANEKSVSITKDTYTYLSDESGIYNQYRGFIDSIFLRTDSVFFSLEDEFRNIKLSRQDTLRIDSATVEDVYQEVGINTGMSNHIMNIQELEVSSNSGKQIKMMVRKGKKGIFLEDFNDSKIASANQTIFRNLWNPEEQNTEINVETGLQEGVGGFDTIYSGNFNYYFQSEYNNELLEKTNEITGEIVKPVKRLPNTVESINRTFRSSKIIPYRAKFTSDYVVTQLDNSVMIHAYDNFNLNGPTFNYPDLSGMITYGLSDLMEDHKIIAGFRVPTNFNGTEVFVTYNNLKKRVDKKLLFYRKTDEVIQPLAEILNQTIINGPVAALTKLKTYYVESSISYPFDVVRSARLHVGYRNDRSVFLPDGELVQVIGGPFIVPGLFADDFVENWLSGKLEYIHDDSKEIAINIPLGLKFKTYFEYYRNLNENKGNLFNFGWDVRHYQRIFKTIIWANRFAGASSWGDRKIVYYLGGVDTWLNSKFDNTIPVSLNEGYAFQSVATNLRGHEQNIRNGNSYILWNTELRVPIFQAIIRKPIKSNFIRNFQIIGFFDAGAAYMGLTPFDEENPFTQETIGNPPVTVDLDFYRNPTVAGYGTGFRTSLLGYFIRVDVGWGIDGAKEKEKTNMVFFTEQRFLIGYLSSRKY